MTLNLDSMIVKRVGQVVNEVNNDKLWFDAHYEAAQGTMDGVKSQSKRRKGG